ncbi:MAG: hypothetical protein WA051_02950 [Minisyncoccia bacterium]
MTKNVLQDMVPSGGGRSIRNIPLPKGRKETPVHRETPVPQRSQKSSGSFSITRYSKPKKVWWWLGGAVVILLVAFAVMSFMSGARVEVTPKIVKANLTSFFNAYKADAITGDKIPANSLPFQVVTISKTGGKTVKANGEEQVQRKASGTLIVYNNTSSASQRLIKNTRFESPEGLIYRVSDSIVVPGQKTVDGKKQPGSVEVLVYADDVGEKYNIGLTDFTIPGFKGDPRYSTIYARSKTPMTGGFVGTVKKVADADKLVAENEIEAALKADLLKTAKSQIPATMILLSGLEKITFTPADQTDPSGDSVKMNTEGTLTAVITDRQTLDSFLSAQAGELKGIPATISNADELTFTLKDGSKFDPARDLTMQFSVKGTENFVGVVNNSDLISALIGKSKNDLQTVKDAFPAIQEMKVSLLPPWASHLPTETKDYTIVINKTN